MNKNVAQGFSIGIIAPIVTLVIYITFILEINIDTALDSFKITNTLTHHISLSVFLTNLILFFVHLKRYKEHIAKGILGATFIYAFIVLYIKFF
tara:strand:+ start:206 stop:487 length:282 start_codon:yes stop_codon:yes gene_type:complete